VLYLTAAITGIRQGELLALRWMDVNWLADRLRCAELRPREVRDAESLGARQPADHVVCELELLFQTSAFQWHEDLVFRHPHTGKPLGRSRLFKRFKAALKRAGVREVRSHYLRTLGTRMSAAGVPNGACRAASRSRAE
jgi:integrase